MKREGEQTLLRVHVRSTDRAGWSLTTSALLKNAFRRRLAGATVLEGIAGLDFCGKILEPGRWSLVRRVPAIIELTDWPAAIGPFVESLAGIIREGIATLERAHVLIYRHEAAAPRESFNVPAAPADRSHLPSPEEFSIMKRAEEGQLLRIFIDHSDVWQDQSLHRAILAKAQELCLASATVFRADAGFGAHHRLHSSRGEYVSDQPLLVEVVDATSKIEAFLPALDQMIGEGLVTIEGVRILRFGPERPRA
jgi:PII-like signaling protein